jgi:selenium metabolism protein YedF
MSVVDVVDKPCPIPVIEAKKALAKLDGKGEVKVIVSGDIPRQNLEKMAAGLGCASSWKKLENGTVEVLITAEKCIAEQPKGSGLVVVVSGNTMGRGNDELGKQLIVNFFAALMEAPPKKLLFYNTGVLLAAADSPVLLELQALEAKGTEILCCGVCDKFFGKADEPVVGGHTSMLDVVETMAAAEHLITI